jgi:hypothetical protein
MAKNRWDMGKPDVGDMFDPGFITAWNARNHGDYETMHTIPFTTPPSTMQEQMDGDENMTAGSRGGRKKK